MMDGSPYLTRVSSEELDAKGKDINYRDSCKRSKGFSALSEHSGKSVSPKNYTTDIRYFFLSDIIRAHGTIELL